MTSDINSTSTPTPPSNMNAEAARFLNIIASIDTNWHFQTFSDKKKADTTSTPEGPFTTLMSDTLATINKHGAGIFVAINTHESKKRRSKKTTKTINAVFADFDDPDNATDHLKGLLRVLPATVVVESSQGKFHAYYVLSNPGSIDVADFPRWQRQISKNFGSDPKVIDPSRVMRLPGYLHQKDEPFQTKIVDALSSGRKYAIDELVAAFYGGRNNWLTSIAGAYREKGLSYDEIYDILSNYNTQLNTPLDDEEVSLISNSVQTYAPNPERLQEYEVGKLVQGLALEVYKNGGIIPSAQNTLKVVKHEGGMRFNQLTNQTEVLPPVLWHRATRHNAWTDMDDTNFRCYLIEKYNCEWAATHVTTAVEQIASLNLYDPLIEYLDSLSWDGVPRVSTVFSRHLHTVDTEYTRAVAENLFIGAVKRAYDPGCKHDNMVVLVGDEGSGKSRFCAIIAKYNEFFTDSLGDLRNKDGVVGIQGKWIIEFGELKSMQGASAEHTKAFLSTQVDNIRLPYGRRTQAFPRRCVFIGTTNNTNFITDTGTNRRMLPIYTSLGEEKGHVMDAAALSAEVDQLWAEAIDMYKSGKTGLIPISTMAQAMEHRLEYTEDGGYIQDIVRYMQDEIGQMVNSQTEPRIWFVPREFYLDTVIGASQEKWVSESRLHKQIINAARKVFAQPEWSDYKYGKYKKSGMTVTGWKKSQPDD